MLILRVFFSTATSMGLRRAARLFGVPDANEEDGDTGNSHDHPAPPGFGHTGGGQRQWR